MTMVIEDESLRPMGYDGPERRACGFVRSLSRSCDGILNRFNAFLFPFRFCFVIFYICIRCIMIRVNDTMNIVL